MGLLKLGEDVLLLLPKERRLVERGLGAHRHKVIRGRGGRGPGAHAGKPSHQRKVVQREGGVAEGGVECAGSHHRRRHQLVGAAHANGGLGRTHGPVEAVLLRHELGCCAGHASLLALDEEEAR